MSIAARLSTLTRLSEICSLAMGDYPLSCVCYAGRCLQKFSGLHRAQSTSNGLCVDLTETRIARFRKASYCQRYHQLVAWHTCLPESRRPFGISPSECEGALLCSRIPSVWQHVLLDLATTMCHQRWPRTASRRLSSLRCSSACIPKHKKFVDGRTTIVARSNHGDSIYVWDSWVVDWDYTRLGYFLVTLM